jgi:hypothetical protein
LLVLIAQGTLLLLLLLVIFYLKLFRNRWYFHYAVVGVFTNDSSTSTPIRQ